MHAKLFIKQLVLTVLITLVILHNLFASQRTEKISLALFHYNLQYVAGKARVEKKIITEADLDRKISELEENDDEE